MEYEWIGELTCDSCGRQGAYDADGEYLCEVCVNIVEPVETEDE